MKNCSMYREHAHQTILVERQKKNQRKTGIELNGKCGNIAKKPKESKKKLGQSFRDCMFLSGCGSEMTSALFLRLLFAHVSFVRSFIFFSNILFFRFVFVLFFFYSPLRIHRVVRFIRKRKRWHENAQCMEVIACIETNRWFRLFYCFYVFVRRCNSVEWISNISNKPTIDHSKNKPLKILLLMVCARGLVCATKCVCVSFFLVRSFVGSFQFIFVGRVPISDYWYLLLSQLHA